MDIGKKELAKEIRAPVLVGCAINRDMWLHDLGRHVVSYLSDLHYERLASGEKTEGRLGICLASLASHIFNYMHIGHFQAKNLDLVQLQPIFIPHQNSRK